VPATDQGFYKMRTDESRAARYEDLHLDFTTSNSTKISVNGKK
jgi:hypothetical protein